MVKVSVIVPVYNKENLLKENVNTILNQSLSDIEIILVNDGSTDNSARICDEIGLFDERVKVIHQINKGVSIARNTGISAATGDYIGFVDPDDWIELDMYKNMYERIQESQAEVCFCNYSVDREDSVHNVLLGTSSEVLNKKQIFEYLILNMIAPKTVNSSEQGVMGSVCRLLIKRQTIEKNNLFFKEKIYLMEDLLFTINLLTKVNKVCIDEEVHYHYVQDCNSAANMYREDLFELNVVVNKELIKCLKENNLYKFSFTRLHNRYINSAQNVIKNEVRNNEKISKKLNNISKVCKNTNLQNSFLIINFKKLSLRKKIVLYSMKHNKSIVLYTYYFLLNLFIE